MKQNKRYIISIMWVIIGAILIALAFAGKVDSFWNGMGSALFIVGIIQLLRYYRFYHNDEYREKMETELSDERNAFIRNKAFAWAGYLFIMITAVASIIFRIIGDETLSLYSSFACCLMLMLYWVSYMILKRKY